MPASYPTSAKVFTTKSDGPGNTILAAHVNDLQLEVTAIEQDLIAGLPVARGGTGATSIGANRLPYGNGGGTAFTSSASLTFDGTTLTAPATAITALLDVSGAAAGQVKFPATQNASADANTFDDYEEGSWTPAFGGSGGQSGQAYSVQVGRYVKKGKEVTAHFRVTLSTLGTITSAVQLQGLPFTSENTTDLTAGLVVGRWTGFTTNINTLGGSVNTNSTVITLWHTTAAATSQGTLAQADLANTSSLEGSITYRATA